MLQTLSKPLTLEAFLALPDTKPASEFIDGQIFQKPMPQGQHSRLQQKLMTAINHFSEDDRIALALPELRCTFGGRSTVPDIAVFTWDRLPTDANGTIANLFNSHPDWVIEILSPDQSMTRVTRNILHCLEHGTQMGWLIDPQEEAVFVYRRTLQGTQTQIFERISDRLPAPEFVQSFDLTVGILFGWLKVTS
jgi:Uma2 family endonuclease